MFKQRLANRLHQPRLSRSRHLRICLPKASATGRMAEGYAELIAVSFLWGEPDDSQSSQTKHAMRIHNHNPVIKMLYQEDNPLDPPTLIAARTLLMAAALGGAATVSHLGRPREGTDETMEDSKTLLPTVTEPCTNEAASLLSAGSQAAEADKGAPFRIAALSLTSASLIVAGLELGLYNFAGTSLQATGIQLMSASKAGFIIQSTAVITPSLAFLSVSSLPHHLGLNTY